MTYITPDKAYKHLARHDAWESGERPGPVTIEWDLSNRCSRGCDGCHFAYTHTRGPLSSRRQADTGDLADTALVLRGLGEAKALGVQGIVWSGGGEPTLHPDFDRIVLHAAALDLAQGLYTHGGHITPWRAALLKDALSWAVVSLDAATADAYTAYKGPGFAAACDGVAALAGGSCVVGVSFLLDADNWQGTAEMIALARSLGATYTTLKPMIYYDLGNPSVASRSAAWVTDALPHLQALADLPDVVCDPQRFVELRDWTPERPYHTCTAIRLNTTITPDGRVWLCPNRRGLPESSIGSIAEEPLAAVWARHPGRWTDFRQCRVMCRLHQTNERLAALQTIQHGEFV